MSQAKMKMKYLEQIQNNKNKLEKPNCTITLNVIKIIFPIS